MGMSMAGATALGAGAQAGTGIIGGALTYRTARKNRELQEDLARNAHQIEVADLRKAGLNPILTGGGKGAQIGGLNAPQINFGEKIASSVQDIAELKQKKKVDKAAITNMLEDINVKRSQEKVNSALEIKALADAENSFTSSKLNKANVGLAFQKALVEAEMMKNINSKTTRQIFENEKIRKQYLPYEGKGGYVFGVLDYLKSWIPFLKK